MPNLLSVMIAREAARRQNGATPQRVAKATAIAALTPNPVVALLLAQLANERAPHAKPTDGTSGSSTETEPRTGSAPPEDPPKGSRIR